MDWLRRCFGRHSLLAVAFLSVTTVELWAGAGGVLSLPIAGRRTPENNSGLQVTIDTTWVEASGHRPVTIEVVAVPPPNADRNLVISLHPSDWSGTRSGVRFEMTLPEKTVRTSKQVVLPQKSNWHQMQIKFFEDGRELTDLSCQVGLPRTSNYEWTEAFPAVLFIDSDAPPPSQVISGVASGAARSETNLPDIMAFAEFLPPYDDYRRNLTRQLPMENGEIKRSTDDIIVGALARLPSFTIRNVDNLPQDVLAYSGIDVYVTDFGDLQTLVRQHPESWRAIQNDLFSGTTLIVYGMDDVTELSKELDELLEVDGLETAAWRKPDDEDYGATTSQHFNRETVALNYDSGRAVEEMMNEDDLSRRRRKDVEVPEPLFRIRGYGSGRIVAFGVDDLSDIDQRQMGWMVGEVGHSNWRWYHRHGLSLRRSNRDFWDFLIPGVGAAPVKTFVGIITCFMIVIGPINYFMLRKFHRLYLLLITVPLGAALITASLYAYALVKDGLGTRLRARSYTEQVADGRLICYSRQSYYAGLVPSEGLSFPPTATFLPVHYDPPSTQGQRRLIDVKKSDRQYTTGYIRSRVVAQGLLIDHREGQPIEVTAEGETPQFKNGLSVEVDYAFVFDNGTTYLCESVAPGESVATTPIELEEAQKKLQVDLSDHRPSQPAGFTPPRRSRQNRWYWNQRVDQGFSKPSFTSGKLEDGIGRSIDTLSPSLRVSGRYCIVVTKKAHEYVAIGIEGARQVGGMHILRTPW